MKIFLLASPYDSGYYKKRLGLGSSWLMNSTKKFLLQEGHDIDTFELPEQKNSFPTEVTASFEVNRSIAELVFKAKTENSFPIIFAGNCNTAIGTLGGLREEVGVVWFDCHGDFNTPETTVGGFLDGMSIAMVTGRCWKNLLASVPGFKPVREDMIVLIGARDFDHEEAKNLSHSTIQLITTEILKQDNLDEHFPPMEKIYLHIDLDVIDPQYVQVNSYSREGGLSPDDLYHLVDRIKKKYSILAVAFTAYDPSLDSERKIEGIVNKLVASIIG